VSKLKLQHLPATRQLPLSMRISAVLRLLGEAIALCVCLSSSSHAANVVAGPITNRANGHQYYLLSPDTWPAAQIAAQKLGGNLATIDDESEQAWVFQTFATFDGIARNLWIGLTDQSLEGTFVWTSGKPLTFQNWAVGAPDSFGDEDYVHMIEPTNGQAGKWNDINGNMTSNDGHPICGIVEVLPPSLAIELIPRITLTGPAGSTNAIEWAESPGSPTEWHFLTNVVLGELPVAFIDTTAPMGGRRMYRTLSRPGLPPGPSGMVPIPAGVFQMGDASSGYADQIPIHPVQISAFYMDKFEVTKGLWDSVRGWAVANGYSFDNVGSGKGPNHPVHTVNWFDAVKWCNARSELEGLVPAYYTDRGLTQVYKAGQRSIPFVNWRAGYRLPTESEWEKAARGGLGGNRFPWLDSDTITHSRANYFSTDEHPYDVSPTRGHNPLSVSGSVPYTSPVGLFSPNGFGLSDMAGNVREWCWDWYVPYPSGPQSDPRGPEVAGATTARVLRGGYWAGSAVFCQVAFRTFGNPQVGSGLQAGFRCVLSAGSP
jgi:formylglycine-generating enzyme